MSETDLIFDAVVFLLVLALAGWRFRFVRETAPFFLLLGLASAAIYFVSDIANFLLGDTHYFANRSGWIAVGIALLSYSFVARLFGRRMRP